MVRSASSLRATGASGNRRPMYRSGTRMAIANTTAIAIPTATDSAHPRSHTARTPIHAASRATKKPTQTATPWSNGPCRPSAVPCDRPPFVGPPRVRVMGALTYAPAADRSSLGAGAVLRGGRQTRQGPPEPSRPYRPWACCRFDWWMPESHSAASRRASTGSSPRRSASM